MITIPKIIWVYWDQGWRDAPELVQKCLDTWQYFNPEFEIRELDAINLIDYIDLSQIFSKRQLQNMSVVAKSDVIRIHLLEKYGGIWVDSTLYCRRPLKDWLPATSKEIFAFCNPGPDRLLSVWFLACGKSSYIITKWAYEARRYWTTRKWRRIYYWPHMVFKNLYKKDINFKEIWKSVIKIPAKGPHHFTPFKKKFFEEYSPDLIEALNEKNPPVVKLTYKCLKDGYPKGSMIDYLLNHYLDDLKRLEH